MDKTHKYKILTEFLAWLKEKKEFAVGRWGHYDTEGDFFEIYDSDYASLIPEFLELDYTALVLTENKELKKEVRELKETIDVMKENMERISELILEDCNPKHLRKEK